MKTSKAIKGDEDKNSINASSESPRPAQEQGLLRIQRGDVLRFRMERGTLLAGTRGVCRVNRFEKSRRGNVVYIDLQQPDGTYVEQFSRHWPFEIAFAPLDSDHFKVFEG